MGSGAPPLSRSIFGADPLDDFAVFVGDWIWGHCQYLSDIEVSDAVRGIVLPLQQIEAKVGRIVDRNTNARIQLPVLTETIVDMRGIRFESNMSMRQHHHFNKLLNELVACSATQGAHGAVRYSHQREKDYFYDETLADTGETVHLRVTRDAKTKQIKPGGVVRKQRIADLNVYCPRRAFDYRISINTETPMEPPPEHSEPSYVREKDRLSYSHQNTNVDLTQVTLPEKPQEPAHELEVEIRDAAQLMHHAQYTRGAEAPTTQDWTPFEDQVLVLLNNVRLLIRNGAGSDEPGR
ncbi:mRNA-capping enzyme subunit beta [Malassezia sp. CBS 17886]|nr:mRNA-capping enzyme subunit beta [Malassezia sp. CBS 17886]